MFLILKIQLNFYLWFCSDAKRQEKETDCIFINSKIQHELRNEIYIFGLAPEVEDDILAPL